MLRPLGKSGDNAALVRDYGRLYWTIKEDSAVGRSLYDRIDRFDGFIRYDDALE